MNSDWRKTTIRRILLLDLLPSLAACETTQFDRDFDSPRDFAAYRSWSWSQPALEYRPDDPRIKGDLTEQRICEAITQQLNQRSLCPAQGNARGDVTVRAHLIVDNRRDQIIANYGGGYWGSYWGGCWGGPTMAETRIMNYKVAILWIDPLDGKDGELVWRGNDERIMRTNPPSPAEREQAIRKTIQKVMSQYPSR